MKKTLLLLFLAVTSLSPACKKSTQPDPCAGFADVTAPVHIGVIFVDKSTGEHILTSKDIDPKKITITPSIEFSVNNIANSDYYGALVFLPQYQKGEFSYNINIPGKGTFTLTFTNEEKITGIPCHPSRVIVGEPSVQGYTVTRLDEHDPYVIKVTI